MRTARTLEVGERFGKLVVIADTGERTAHYSRIILCRCDCGREKRITQAALVQDKTKSCGGSGCRIYLRHGDSHSPEYNIWHGMRARCCNPTDKDYHRYGGRGITVDPRWDDFETFLADVGRKPSPEYSIDRIDNSRGYEPGNVRWSTVKEQARNRRSNVLLEHEGQCLTMAEWAEKLGIGITTLCERLRAGWSVEQALTTPVRRYRG